MTTPSGDRTTPPATATAAPEIPHHSFFPDIASGMFLGDYSKTLGPAGAVTQVIVSFLPGIGTVASLRDLSADLRKPELLGIILNSLSVVPVLGGFTKTAEVLSKVSFAGESFVCVHGIREREAFKDGAQHKIPANHVARTSVMAAFFAPLVAVVLAVLAVVPLQHPLLSMGALWGAFALPLVAIITGHWGVHRAKRLRRITPDLLIEPGIITARTGSALGWLGVFMLLLVAPGVAAITTYVFHPGAPMLFVFG